MTMFTIAVNYGLPNRELDFKYDYLGRRVEKKVIDVPAGNTVISCRRYLYDGWDLVAEIAGPGDRDLNQNAVTAGTLVRSYTWGLDIASSLDATGGVGALIQITDHASGKVFVPTYDGNGNVASLVNGDSGSLAAAYEYGPFGEALRSEVFDSVVTDQPFRFSTKFLDAETGLTYYGARYYSAEMGRFMNRDPIGEGGGINLYGFCGNDGINGVDYIGYSWLSKLFKKATSTVKSVINAVYTGIKYAVVDVIATVAATIAAAVTYIATENIYYATAAFVATYGVTFRSARRLVFGGSGSSGGGGAPGSRGVFGTGGYSRSSLIMNLTMPIDSDDPERWAIWRSDVINGVIEPDRDDWGYRPDIVAAVIQERTERRQAQGVREVIGLVGDAASVHPVGAAVVGVGEGIAGEDLRGNKIEDVDRASRILSPFLNKIRYVRDLMVGVRIGKKATDIKKAEPPKKGVYEFPDQKDDDAIYVGQSSNLKKRLRKHESDGRLKPGTEATTEMPESTKTQREVAEHKRIQEHTNGVPARDSDAVSNKVDPIGPNRKHLLDNPEKP